jgi:hypothetical protein
MRASTHGFAIMVSIGAFFACSRFRDEPIPAVRVDAGIFFGGQLQERTKWPLLIDPARQSQGFRIRFRTPLRESAHLVWDLTRPKLDHKRRVVLTKSEFEASLPAGTEQTDQVIVFDENDRIGKWKLDVTLDGTNVYGTTLEVVPFSPSPNDD